MTTSKKYVRCKVCSREVAVVGDGPQARIVKHNGRTQHPTMPWRNRVSEEQCSGSGVLLLSIEISEAENAHSIAKNRFEAAENDLADAHAEMLRTARVLDELRAQQSSSTKKRKKGSSQ